MTSTGAAMREVVADVQVLSDEIRKISQASEEQSAGVGAIAATLGDLEANTQQNAGLVEQSAAAAASMRTESERLVEATTRFRLGHAGS